ncbi:AI-2E family transporter [Microbacterium barkeri]|uniref:AI-2E family transporter n=1 Tax=Microbacterium barkeri TaxID=33917 RepID=A0A9W6H0I4_9MICO|nr:AI-2E family transporter [Microbacterium barkeri]MDI6942029.1 AI-2E family transporter [Microbacterium barkeri]MDR6875902.1 putative PurR-regulated permease PerM [Microbacterium barkeri]GLJ60020.1 AI-2E family transporter [Microbacterium barkeri]
MKIHNPFRLALVATLGVGLGLLLIEGLQSLSTIILYVGTALFISLGLDPVVSWLERRRLPRWLAVTIAILAVLGLFTGIVLIILPVLVDQIGQLVGQITLIVNRGTFLDDLREWSLATFPTLEIDTVLDFVNDWLTSNIDTISEGVVGVTLNVVQGLFGAFIVLILTIYLTASTPSLKSALYRMVPASKREGFTNIAEQITDSVGYYVMGQITLAAINGVLSAIFLTIIDAPYPTVLAVVAFLGSMIPLVGTISGSTIIALTCLIPGLGSPTTAIIAAVYYLVYMQIEAYVLSPRIMSRAVSVPGGVVVIAALAGGALLGLLGALIAIPVAASVLIIYRQVLIPRMNAR